MNPSKIKTGGDEMLNNQKGFSFIQVMIAAALLGGLSLVSMQLVKNISNVQNILEAKSDEMDLRAAMEMILRNESFCRVSIAGDGAGAPTTFHKIDVDDTDNEDEGLNISLWYANQAGNTRTQKKLNGQNNPEGDDKSTFGKLKIRTLKLYMNNNPASGPAVNYPNSANHNDMGLVRAVVEKRTNGSDTREVFLNFPVNVRMRTGQTPDASGETRILSCFMGNFNDHSVDILESGQGYDGMTGNAACLSIGKSCAKVVSHNFPREDLSGTNLHAMRICLTRYNQSLPGVEDTTGPETADMRDNVHSCDARIGTYTTYLDVGVLRCNALFQAICF